MKKNLFSQIAAIVLCFILAFSYISVSAPSIDADTTETESGYPVMPLDDAPPKEGKE